MKVLQFPLTKITFGFIAGILFAFYIKPGAIPVFCALALGIVCFATAFYRAKKQLARTFYFGLTAYCLAFLVGSAALIIHSGTIDPKHYIRQINDPAQLHTIEVVLRERPKSTAYRNRYIALARTIDGKACSGKILVNLDIGDFPNQLVTGTHLKITSCIIPNAKPKNPAQFDYGQYLSTKAIPAQVYAGAEQVKTASTPANDIFYQADRLRMAIIGNLAQSGMNQAELAVIAALILGQQQDIDPEIIRDYQFAGAVHVLSVSGLHVGFILMLLNFALGFLPKNNRWIAYAKLAVTIASLWGFAVLAGLSPSVVRSVTMFSFVAVGLYLKRQTNIFHTLLVSMLLILLFEPSFLFDVGFQLSYLALFFIVWLQPFFAGMWQPENKIMRYFWQILTVSFAAQIGTLPLSLYYFHQFPGLFFVTNLVVIPLLAVIMGLGVATMLPAVFGTVSLLLVKPLEWLVLLLNRIIGGIASYEQFIFEEIAFNRWMMLTLYLVIVSVVVWLKQPDYKKAMLVSGSVIVFQLANIGTHWQTETTKQWIAFNARKATLIAQRNGKRLTVLSSEKHENKALRSYATAYFVSEIQRDSLQNVAYFGDKKILIIDNRGIYPVAHPDVLYLRQSPKINLERLLQRMRPKVIVADASNYKSYSTLWEATCQKNKIPFHNISEMGYFEL